jgi:hypothetical protein
MTWNPSPTVTIKGLDFTSESLWNVSVSYGRTTIWEQARSGYAVISLLNPNNLDFDLDPNNSVVVTVDDSAGNPVTIFTGKVTSISNSVQKSGTSGTVVIQTITALSVFADMARKVIGDNNWSKEYDDDRMTRIFTDAGVTIDTVDTPPVYEFTARSASPADAYTLAATYATQAFGYIYETPLGEVGYANESRRFVSARDNGFLTLPKDYILYNSVKSQKTLSDIMNSIILSYKANAQVDADDPTSIIDYGLAAGSVTTELENMSEAQQQADRYVTLRAYPRTSLSSFSIPLDSSEVSAADLDDLLAVSMDTAIRIFNLPIGIKNTTYSGFVEGWTFSINRVQANLTIDTSDYSYSVTPTRWQDVPATLTWAAVPATVQWDTYDG